MGVEAHRNSLPIQAKKLNIMKETDKAPRESYKMIREVLYC